ncbi:MULTISPECIES: 50S ribosomal protein L1 [Leptospirillum]|jgi:large subunit ribosomal protein L1|uniref:Large ribosomal subunit protein uL1 n=2 Tax=Leptospirillum ferriphilum TaxID=178606 RepID=A0A1V3SVD6_9BACT|nr:MULTISPECIES: 50S ribosomal protein L1 [Leptospirillum]EAY55966.1 MAG: ribosomal protein L1 [Leptospirillum rubarum]EIJ76284.1 MAG: Ribosomal protein L1 [Leptospirillum sp. Group II 'C75']AFS53801.1 ribosomal protein L1 [Leptospirillum ferriphilum ML-04]AKS23257.1 50S ribosomal protein L1 [Leptospirillum sp. Group II 'CF-1']OOH72692.1 50S ribosomal protein L1 [Leptospirillum ferriphilum]
MSEGKKIKLAKSRVENRLYSVDEAIALIKEIKFAAFDESVDLAVNLGVDPRHSDQMVRAAVLLPHGIGKKVRVLVFAKGEKEKEALDEKADYVGADDLVARIQEGWLDFDTVIATPDLMGMVGRLGKVLGPRGLMPNPKTGTVTFEIGRAVKEAKQGKVEFKSDKGGVLHFPIGRASFDVPQIRENLMTAFSAIAKAKPQTSKGKYIRQAVISTTMGPGVIIDVNSILKEVG